MSSDLVSLLLILYPLISVLNIDDDDDDDDEKCTYARKVARLEIIRSLLQLSMCGLGLSLY